MGVNGATLGWLISVEINGPWAQSGGGGIVWTHSVSATLMDETTTVSVPVVVSQCGTTHCAASGQTCNTANGATTFGCYFGGGFGIFARQALTPNHMYRVVLTAGTVTDTNISDPSPGPFPANYSWCFSTGPTHTPSADCTAPAVGTGGLEPAVQLANLTVSAVGQGTVSGSGISCPGTCSTSSRRDRRDVDGHAVLRVPVQRLERRRMVWQQADLQLQHRQRHIRDRDLCRAEPDSQRGVVVSQLEHVTAAGAGRVSFSTRARKSSLTIVLTNARSGVQVTVMSPAIQAKPKKHQPKKLKFKVQVTDAAGTVTTVELTLSLAPAADMVFGL
jgi:hypothetical protein